MIGSAPGPDTVAMLVLEIPASVVDHPEADTGEKPARQAGSEAEIAE